MHEMEVSFPGGKKTEVLMNGFTVISDQPQKAGGDGSAPSPFDYFLISIASCAGFYASEFCKGRNIPTDELSIQFTTEYDHEKKMLSQINITVVTPPEFPEKYADAILRSVDQCSVKRHLMDPPKISIQTQLR